jgi:hypothetical protein
VYRPVDCQLFPYTFELKKDTIFLTLNKNCIAKPSKKIAKKLILVAKKSFSIKELIKYAEYNLHTQIKKEIIINKLSAKISLNK